MMRRLWHLPFETFLVHLRTLNVSMQTPVRAAKASRERQGALRERQGGPVITGVAVGRERRHGDRWGPLGTIGDHWGPLGCLGNRRGPPGTGRDRMCNRPNFGNCRGQM